MTTLTVHADGDVSLSGEESPAAYVVFDSAPVNALSLPFLEGLRRAVELAGPSARALVLASALPKVFMAGGDIETLRQHDAAARERYVVQLQETFELVARLPCPVISQVEGHCLGGGLELALAGDLVVAAEDAHFGLPEVRLGILPAAGGVHRLVRRTGEGRARLLMLTGRRIDATTAASYGIVDELCPPGEVAAAVKTIVDEIVTAPTPAVQAIKRLTNGALDVEIGEGLRQELAEWVAIRATPEAQRALDEFVTDRGRRRS